MSCDTKTPYAGDDGILPHKKGKFVIEKLKSSLLSYIFVDKDIQKIVSFVVSFEK